jgi:hypothetical protein
VKALRDTAARLAYALGLAMPVAAAAAAATPPRPAEVQAPALPPAAR